MQIRIWSAAALAGFSWGTATVVSRVALGDGANAYDLTLMRCLIAGVAVIGYVLVRGRLRWPDAITARVGIVMGITTVAAPFVLSNLALEHASAGFVALPTALIPLLTAALAHGLLPDERITPAKTTGLVVALIGAAVLLLSGDSGLEAGGRPLLAGGLGLAAAMSIALGSIYAKRYAGRYDVFDVSGIQFVAGAVVTVAAAAAVGERVGAVPVAAWPEIVFLGLVATALPSILYYWLLRRVTATYASVIGYIVPLFSVVLGMVWLDEQLQPGIVIGGALILTGVLITDRLERAQTASGQRP